MIPCDSVLSHFNTSGLEVELGERGRQTSGEQPWHERWEEKLVSAAPSATASCF